MSIIFFISDTNTLQKSDSYLFVVYIQYKEQACPCKDPEVLQALVMIPAKYLYDKNKFQL